MKKYSWIIPIIVYLGMVTYGYYQKKSERAMIAQWEQDHKTIQKLSKATQQELDKVNKLIAETKAHEGKTNKSIQVIDQIRKFDYNQVREGY